MSCFNISDGTLSESDYSNFCSTIDGNSCPDDFLCSEDYVFHLIHSLNVDKSSGPDGISVRMLKYTALSITPSVTRLFNLSIKTGLIPSIWKTAAIVPIPKGIRDHSSPSNYRPISLLPILSKLLECHISGIIKDQLQGFFSPNQFGFLPKRSTVAALLSVIFSISSHLDCNQSIETIFLDLRKAFDSVPHTKLLHTLLLLNLDPWLIRWLFNYLIDRQQFVMVSGENSKSCMVASGVPQGSVLGPILFLIYINDVTNINLSRGSELRLFADDILLFRPISSNSDYDKLQHDIDRLFAWSKGKSLAFNVEKCKAMFISLKSSVSSYVHVPLTMNNINLEVVESFKYLGVILDNHLSWDAHIDYICMKSKCLLGFMYRHFYSIADSATLRRLYIAYVRPHLDYAAPVWGPHLLRQIDQIEKIQKFACRMSMHSWKHDYPFMLENLKLHSLQSRRLYLKLMLFYNIFHSNTYFPNSPPPIFIINSDRRNNFINVPFAYHNTIYHFFFLDISRFLNNHPVLLKSLNNPLSVFKRDVFDVLDVMHSY